MYIRLAPTDQPDQPGCLKPPTKMQEDCQWRSRCVRQHHFSPGGHGGDQGSIAEKCEEKYTPEGCQSYRRHDNYPFCEYHHPKSDNTKGACHHIYTGTSGVSSSRYTTYGACSGYKDVDQCTQNYMPGHDWNRCEWWMGPRLVWNNRYCNDYTANLIKPIITNIEFTHCDKACSDHPLCVGFFYGRVETSYRRRCYLQRKDWTAPSNSPCTQRSGSHSYDTYWPSIGEHKPSTTPNKCTHLQVFNKVETKRNQCSGISSKSSCPAQKCGWREVRSVP